MNASRMTALFGSAFLIVIHSLFKPGVILNFRMRFHLLEVEFGVVPGAVAFRRNLISEAKGVRRTPVRGLDEVDVAVAKGADQGSAGEISRSGFAASRAQEVMDSVGVIAPPPRR
jgi:hypothetical protein